jgi:hypothetical protein
MPLTHKFSYTGSAEHTDGSSEEDANDAQTPE